MRSASLLWARKSSKACAVVAKPPGTRTPARGELADQLAERGVLAADRLDVGHAQGVRTERPGRSPDEWLTWEGSGVDEKPASPAPLRCAASAVRGLRGASTRCRASGGRGAARGERVHECVVGSKTDARFYGADCLSSGEPRAYHRPHERMPDRTRLLRLRRHRHHRRDPRHLDPDAVRGQPAPRAPALHRHRRTRRTRSSREINDTAEHEGKQPIVFITLVNPEILRDRQGAVARPGARHVRDLHRAARGASSA